MRELFSLCYFPALTKTAHLVFSNMQQKKKYTFSAALELSGTPLPYFPEMIPQASGDHVIAPTPAEKAEKEILGDWEKSELYQK